MARILSFEEKEKLFIEKDLIISDWFTSFVEYMQEECNQPNITIPDCIELVLSHTWKELKDNYGHYVIDADEHTTLFEIYDYKNKILIETIKDNGLEYTLKHLIDTDILQAKKLVGIIFSNAFDNLSDEDYEQFVLNVCDCLK